MNYQRRKLKGLDVLKDLGVIEIVFSGRNSLLRDSIDDIDEIPEFK